MRSLTRLWIGLCAVAAVLTAFSNDASRAQEKSADELVALLKSKLMTERDVDAAPRFNVITCDQSGPRLTIYKGGADWNAPDSVVWNWEPSDSLPAAEAKRFSAIDECKPALNDSAVLTNASAGAVALIRLSDKKVLFYGFAGGNTHSVALLPDGNVVSASSTGRFLALFATPEGEREADAEATPIYKTFELDQAHGVVWDAKRKTLWALGYGALVGYEYVGTKSEPDLREIFRLPLEGKYRSGHDLYPASGYDALVTTDGTGINVFDPEKRTLTRVADYRNIKSVSVSPDGETLVLQPTEEWWSESVLYGDSSERAAGTKNGARFYKARWFVPNRFSEPE